MEDCRFHGVALRDLASLRQLQTLDLKGQVHDPLEERIQLGDPVCLTMAIGCKEAGYALLDLTADTDVTLLEFYVVHRQRPDAKAVLNELIASFHCAHWFVNTQDSFSLPLLLDSGFAYELDGYIFSIDAVEHRDAADPQLLCLDRATLTDLESTYELIMQDGFYTGNGRQGLAVRIDNGEIYLLKSETKLIGVGFVSPLARTPNYADIAMIIDKQHRRKGLGARLVTGLVGIALNQGLNPTALTSPGNPASRRTLEKCAFHLDGCMLLARLGAPVRQKT